jgi:hypothetical protein
MVQDDRIEITRPSRASRAIGDCFNCVNIALRSPSNQPDCDQRCDGSATLSGWVTAPIQNGQSASTLSLLTGKYTVNLALLRPKSAGKQNQIKQLTVHLAK